MRRRLALASILCCALGVHAQPAPEDPFAPIRFFGGDWRGTASGEPGAVGAVERSYAFVLEGHFLHERNTTTYAPHEKNPQGEVHEHWSFFSYDRARKRILLRQFHEESFVNIYVLAPESAAQKLVFVSEDFENFDDAWRARETYELRSADELVETFELAPPGKEFAVYSRSELKRVAR
jgi:hypothetical protein